jgi:ankyrin repeat protein
MMKRRYESFPYLFLIGFLVVYLNGLAYSDQRLNESFLKAIYGRDFSLMDKLIAEGVDVNAPIRNDLTPLAEAAFAGDLEVVDYLLRKGAKVEGTQKLPNSPIYFAIINGNTAVVGRFLDLGVAPNYTWPAGEGTGGTLLTAAVDAGHMEIVKLLVQRGADVNFRGSGNYGALYRAVFSDYFDIFKFLLSNGACLNERDKAALSGTGWEKNEKYKKYIQLLQNNQECKKK